MIALVQKIFGESWKKYTIYFMAVMVLLMRNQFGLTDGGSNDALCLIAFALISSAYLLGQGFADWGKSRALIESSPAADGEEKQS